MKPLPEMTRFQVLLLGVSGNKVAPHTYWPFAGIADRSTRVAREVVKLGQGDKDRWLS